MSAPTSPTPVFDPAVPMSPEFRSDLAYRLADGWTWKELAETLNCNADELRRATENDPEFAAVQERTWARVIWEGEADGMRRLRRAAAGEGASAIQAAEVLVKYAHERRHEETRLAIEKMRAETRLQVEKLRTERAANRKGEWKEEPAPETEAERAKRLEHEHASRAAEPESHVYIWGGKHPIGRCFAPDETDTRVRVMADDSCRAGKCGTVHWIVPDPPSLAATMHGESGGRDSRQMLAQSLTPRHRPNGVAHRLRVCNPIGKQCILQRSGAARGAAFDVHDSSIKPRPRNSLGSAPSTTHTL